MHTHLFQTTADFTTLQIVTAAQGDTPLVICARDIEWGTWNDRASSFVIVSGNWQFFSDTNFGNPYGGTLGPGSYPWVEDVGIANDTLSSVKVVD